MEGVEEGEAVGLLVTLDMTRIDLGQVRECVGKGKGAEELFNVGGETEDQLLARRGFNFKRVERQSRGKSNGHIGLQVP